MATNNITKRGVCINHGNCSKATKKEVIEINIGEDFVCPECNSVLVEVKSKPFPVAWAIGVGCIVILLLIGIYAAFNRTEKETLVEKPEKERPERSPQEGAGAGTDVDSIAPVPQTPPEKKAGEAGPDVKKDAAPQGGLTGQGSVDLGYGKYTGNLKNGKAYGSGTLVYTRAHLISKHDSKKRMAEPGDYVIGVFKNNEVVNVQWYGKDKVQKGTVMAGEVGIP